VEFELIPYTVTSSVVNNTGGSVSMTSGANPANHGSGVTFTAAPDTGYQVKG